MQNYRLNLHPSVGQISNQILCRPFTPSNKGHNRAFSDKQNYQRNTKNIRKNGLNFQNQLDKINQVPTKRPLISPCRTNYSNEQQRHSQVEQRKFNRTFENSEQLLCVNHPNKTAQFTLQVQSQQLGYCKKCAVKLASQGFTVSKISSQTLRRGQFLSFTQNMTKRQLPKIPQYQSNAKYKQISQFLLQLQKMQAQHLTNMSKLTKIDSQYEEQIRNTELYYSQLLLFVQKMRDDHLSDLQKQKRRDTQIAFIEHDYLRENFQQMNNIWNDIEQNLDNIVMKMEEEEVKSSLRYYKEKVQVYKHKIQEMNQFFDKLIILQTWEYQQKLERVQDFLMKVWIVQSNQNTIKYASNQPQVPIISHQIRMCPPKSHPQLIKAAQLLKNHNINPQSKPKNQKTQHNQSTAFRKLFLQEQQQKQKIIASPQFKQI